MFIFQQSALTHCASTRALCPSLSDVSEAPELSSPFALRSFQGNMCAGILPQLRQGLAGFTVGTGRVWESRGSVPLSFPHSHSASFSVAVVHQAGSLPCLSHPYCNSSSSLFSPYIIFSTLFIFTFSSSHLIIFPKINFLLFPPSCL